MEETFKVGDVVVLKSGGPDMTIEKFVWDDLNQQDSKDKVECVWFENNKVQSRTFYISTLEK